MGYRRFYGQMAPYQILVGGIPLKNMRVSWDDDSQYTEKQKMFQTTIFHFLMRPAVDSTAARLGHSCTNR